MSNRTLTFRKFLLVLTLGVTLISAACAPSAFRGQGLASSVGSAQFVANAADPVADPIDATPTSSAFLPTAVPTQDPILAQATATAESALPEIQAKIERAKLEEKAAVQQAAIWRQQPPSIAVCWDTPGFDIEKGWVREAISRTWVQESALAFIGWQACVTNARGIRITIQDVGPYTFGVGEQLDGRLGGMVLNFSFQNWSTSCADPESQRKFCIESIAAHEFGHAIGFTHEQNRDDAPRWCSDQAQGGNPDLKVTEFDIQSIMNYCNPSWNNSGLLSALDIHAVRILYGVPAYGYWQLDETSGQTAKDASWKNNHGVIVGATYTKSMPSLGTSINRSALLFSKEGDYVQIPAGPATNLNRFKTGLTVEAFIKPSTLPIPLDRANQRIKYILWADDDAYSLALRSDSAGKTTLNATINCGISPPGRGDVGVSAPFDPQWVVNGFAHVAFTFGDGSMSLYINKTKVAEVSSSACGNTAGPVSSRGIVHIGSDETAICCNHDRDFRGIIDEIRISARPLNVSEFLGLKP